MRDIDVIIIGAGAAGLMAARELLNKNKTVLVLEARDRVGGRIHTLYDQPFTAQVELGAEFIHGDLPVTMKYLNEAGIAYHATDGDMWQAKDGKLTQADHFIEHWDAFEEKLKILKEDISINEFLEQKFGGEEYDGLKRSVRQYAAGYDTADPDRASAIALRQEWLEEDEAPQYRLTEGYGKMVESLVKDCVDMGGVIHIAAVVKQINHVKGEVTITTTDGNTYTAGKAVVTVPVGVLQATDEEEGAILFSPELPQVKEAAKNMGMGSVIKILLQFDEPFWEHTDGEDMSGMAFVFSQEAVPTWWTQYPLRTAMLTGWMGGAIAAKLKGELKENILQLALQSLGSIFGMGNEVIKKKLTAWKVVNWEEEPFSRGSYSYATVKTAGSRKVLVQGVNDTIFFAGEAINDGPVMGTVEAALASGVEVARRIK